MAAAREILEKLLKKSVESLSANQLSLTEQDEKGEEEGAKALVASLQAKELELGAGMGLTMNGGKKGSGLDVAAAMGEKRDSVKAKAAKVLEKRAAQVQEEETAERAESTTAHHKTLARSQFLEQLEHDLFIIKNRNYLDRKVFYRKQKDLYKNVSSNPLAKAKSTGFLPKSKSLGGSSKYDDGKTLQYGIGVVIDPNDIHKPNHAKMIKTQKTILDDLLENHQTNVYLKSQYKAIGEKANNKTRGGRKVAKKRR